MIAAMNLAVSLDLWARWLLEGSQGFLHYSVLLQIAFQCLF